MNTIKKLRNYWIGMLMGPFILVTACAIRNDDLSELLTKQYLFSDDMGWLLGATILVIAASYVAIILEEGILRDFNEIKNYLKQKGGVAR